jgi:hypothetical protein
MNIGTLKQYPELTLSGCKVPAGRAEWLRFVCDAGYTLVSEALAFAQQLKEQEREGAST